MARDSRPILAGLAGLCAVAALGLWLLLIAHKPEPTLISDRKPLPPAVAGMVRRSLGATTIPLLPPFHLISGDGELLTNRTLAGHPALLFFLEDSDSCRQFAYAWVRERRSRPKITAWGVSATRHLTWPLWRGAMPLFPVQYDPGGQLTAQMGAEDSPQVRLVDARGHVAWSGGGHRIAPEALAHRTTLWVKRMARFSQPGL